MFCMLKNELYKIFHSRRIYVFLSILFVFSAALAVLISSITPSEQISEEMLKNLKGAYFPVQILSTITDLLLPIFITLIITFIISDEYDNGTLKLPLLHGFSRGWVIVSKVLASTIVMILMLAFVYVVSYGAGLIFWGSSVIEKTVALSTLKAYLLTMLPFLAFIIIASFLAILFKNSGVVIGIVVAILVLSSFIGALFPDASTYIITYYLKAFSSSVANLEYLRAVIVCLIYGVVFYIASYLKFFKMEIQK